MARMLAQAVHCLEQVDDACGHCLECRKMTNGNHPDVHWLEPDGQSIKIDQIRELQKAFSYRSSASTMKIYIIDGAERMTMQAANSLLKFLEEPMQTVMAILITDNGQALLPTIRSRAQEVRFVPMNSEYMQQVLEEEGFASSLTRPAVALTAGVYAARELIQEEWFAEARRVVLQLAEETLERSSAGLITVQQLLFQCNQIYTVLLKLLLHYFDL